MFAWTSKLPSLQENSFLGPYDDEETRIFYASLPDLKTLVPSILLKGQEKEGTEAEATEPAEKDASQAPEDKTGDRRAAIINAALCAAVCSIRVSALHGSSLCASLKSRRKQFTLTESTNIKP